MFFGFLCCPEMLWTSADDNGIFNRDVHLLGYSLAVMYINNNHDWLGNEEIVDFLVRCS